MSCLDSATPQIGKTKSGSGVRQQSTPRTLPGMTRRQGLVLALAAVLFTLPALAAPPSYLSATQVDLMHLLAPPPATGSATDRAEMDEVVAIEQTRTPERAKQARVDADEDVFVMFASLMGPAFLPANLPIASHLFERLGETEEEIVTPAKSGFARPRPYQTNPALHPAAPTSRSGTYPSGHATRGTIMGAVLASMVPERRAEIFARVEDYAESRVIAGVHYRSDIVAGRQAGTAAVAVLMNDPGFMAEYGPARAEIRTALALAP